MTDFGTFLRTVRKRCIDPDFPGKSLSQERLGEFLGRELGFQGSFSGTAISDWERGKSRIRADDRLVLTSLLIVLHQLGGIETITKANQLLELGNYRTLNQAEIKQIFPEGTELPVSSAKPENQQSIATLLFGEEINVLSEELQTSLAQAREGPSPAWPRVFVALLRTVTDRLSVLHIFKVLLWVWIWLAMWATVMPSLRWPFVNREHAKTVIVLYAVASFAPPLLTGLFTNTRNNEFWQKQDLANAAVTRLYTYQGAFIGFHLGYFAAFAIGLIEYYLQLHITFWFELIIMTIPLMVAYLGARLVPYNLWQAYKRLSLTDGNIFFSFIALGPLWGIIFWKFYPIILMPFTGGTIILLAMTLLVALMAWQYRRNRTTVIPVYWWLILFGSVIICQIIVSFIQ